MFKVLNTGYLLASVVFEEEAVILSFYIYETDFFGISSTHLPLDKMAGQNGRHFADDIFRCVPLNKKYCILIKISLKFVLKGLIDNNPALV